jgi:hypothetical protein
VVGIGPNTTITAVKSAEQARLPAFQKIAMIRQAQDWTAGISRSKLQANAVQYLSTAERREEKIMAQLGNHAIVIGASMGGLLAARALADHYQKVTIVERDALPEVDEARKGVPQGRHLHGLLARGREVLEHWFPNFTEEMVAQGALSADIVNQGLWFNHGVFLSNVPSNLSGLAMSRPMLEGGVRRRLLQIPSVRLREQCDALETGI